ncbi:unnamed protein product [Lactuca virosa]|uniref:UMP-CMP kinase n=1 Tax=Lactuca virosa TaxID=75947 RepID=A0AAU9NT65_9ASTR|nr:unnamed protein product [Lactuca virosa]
MGNYRADLLKDHANYDYFYLELFASTTWEWRELRNIRLSSYVYPVSDEAIISGCVVYFLLSNYDILRFDISRQISSSRQRFLHIELMGTVVDSANKEESKSVLSEKKPKVVFVLGGPGSGKGTQCANIVEHFGYTHLSAGDLLRAEIKSGSKNGTMIQNMISEGIIVPSEVTIKLLEKAIMENENDKFLIDGFPRNEENRAAFESVTGIIPEFVLFFDCSEEEMEKRLLGRNQGRVDDNIETIRKRFKVFVDSSLAVIEYYNSKGKVKKIDAGKPVGEVFEAVKAAFAPAK